MTLIDEVEQLTTFSREVDARIWCEWQGYEFVRMVSAERFSYVADHQREHRMEKGERYTGRIDDAMALVRLIHPGCFVTITDWGGDVYAAIQPGDKSTQRTGSAKTMPLAIVLALLRCGLRPDPAANPDRDMGHPQGSAQSASAPG